MRKESHSAFYDINSKLQKRLNELEEINYDICQCAQGFATLNSSILSFFDQLKQIVNDENNLFIQTNCKNGKKDDKHDLALSYSRFFTTKDDFLINYSKLSKDLSEFISMLACKTLCDEFTTSKLQEIKKRFYKITEIKKDINYRIKFNGQNQIIPCKLSNTILIKHNKIKTKLEASEFIQKISDNSNNNTENFESLNKFYVSLEPIRDKFLEKLSSLKATYDDAKIYQRHPSPKMLGNYSEFEKYIKIRSKLKSAFDALFEILSPYYVKISRKQQQIVLLVSDLTTKSSKMYKTLKSLEDETNRYTNVECLYRKISVIDNSNKSYQFFEPEKYTNFILKFIDEEKDFFKEVDNRIKYCKGSTNSSSNTSSGSSTSVVNDDNVENRLSITYQQQLFDLFNSFYSSIVKNINIFEEKNIFFQLEDKLKKKKKLEIDFPTKYPRANSSPDQSLLDERKEFDKKTKSANCAFEIINADINNTISNFKKIEIASSSFTGIHDFLKKKDHFLNTWYLTASNEWANQVADEFKAMIQNKKEEIEKIKIQLAFEIKMKDYVDCCHTKSICLASCGHTFCENCLYLGNVSNNWHGFCPKCHKEFSMGDIIHIKW